jgi:DNA-binding MarR family transcriptional regulator
MISPTAQTGPRPEHRIAKELASSSAFLLARLGGRFKMRLIAKLDDAGYEGLHYSVLAMLAEGARQTQAGIAVALHLDPSRLVAVLDALEADGLIERQRDPQDRRRHVVSITKDGKRQLLRMREVFKGLEDEFLAPLDAHDREALHGLLVKLAQHNDPACIFRPIVGEPPPQS